jgi:hypothetical protein
MFKERWDSKKFLKPNTSIKIVNIIPDNGYSISGSLHAPFEDIRDKSVSFGAIAEINGPKLNPHNSNRNSYLLRYCHRLPSEKICAFYTKKEVKVSPNIEIGSLDDMLSFSKGLCGIFLYDVAGNTYKDDIKEKKDLIRGFLERKYSIGTLEVFRGINQTLIGREKTEMPEKPEPTERFFLNNIDSDSAFAFLDWDDKIGKSLYLDPFRDVLSEIGFQKVKK